MEVWESAVKELCSMSALLWLAIKDKKWLEIKRGTLLTASGILLIAGVFEPVEWWSRVGGALFGIMMLVFCFFSKEAMGFADGIILLVCGIAFGISQTVMLCFFGALYAGLFSAILLVTHRAQRKSRIPFLPFLLLGYVTMTLLMHVR